MESPMDYNISTQTRKKFILNSIKDNDRIILDIGCGIGYFTNIISKNGKIVIGGDRDKISVNLASKNGNSPFLIIDAQNLPFKDSAFDCILSTEVIEHVPDYDSFLSEISRVMKKTGKFILTTESTEGILSPPIQHCHKHGYEKQSHEAFSERKIKDMFKENNIKIEKIEYSLSFFTKILLDLTSIFFSKKCPNFARQSDIYKVENSFSYKLWKFFFPLTSLTIKIDYLISKLLKGSCIMVIGKKL